MAVAVAIIAPMISGVHGKQQVKRNLQTVKAKKHMFKQEFATALQKPAPIKMKRNTYVSM